MTAKLTKGYRFLRETSDSACQEMKTLSKNLSILILCWFGCVFCSTSEPYTELASEIKKKSVVVEYKSSVFKVVDNVKITAPVIKHAFFKTLVDEMIKKDQRYDYCDGNKGEVYVNYKVLHLSDNLISIRKDVEIMHCYPGVILYSKFVTALAANGKTWYVGLANSDKVKPALLRAQQKNDECKYNLDELMPDLFIANNKLYVDVIADKVCELQAPIELSSGLIKFNENAPKED